MLEPDEHEPLRGSVIAYVLKGYPSLSQTFVRDEIATLRAAGYAVDVTSMERSDQERIPRGWSGPYRTTVGATWREGARDLLWWALHRPRAVLRLALAVRASGYASGRELLREVPIIARRLDARDVRVVHAHFGWRAMTPSVYIAALLGCPATVTLHAADIYLPGPDFARRVNQLDGVVTVCAYNITRLAAMGVELGRISLVPCGVDVDVEVLPVQAPQRVVSVGRLVRKKGMDVLVRAFRAAVDDAPGAHLEIIGEGPCEPELRELVASEGLEAHVTFSGALEHAETLARISRAGVFALACRVGPDGDSDAVPVALREAMARARPIVTTAVAGIGENVDADVGWVVPSDDVDAFARALAESLADPVLSAAKGAAGRQRQVEHYTLERSMELLTRMWSGVIDGSAGRSR